MKGISTHSEQVAVWIESWGVRSHIAVCLDDMYIDEDNSEKRPYKHKEGGEKRRRLDCGDRQRILNELETLSHPLYVDSEFLYNIVNGRVAANNDVNVQDAVQIGTDMYTAFASSIPDGFHKPIQKTVKTMQGLRRGVKVKDRTVYDLQAIFSRFLVAGQKRSIDIPTLFQHELSPVPPSLINEYGCLRKGNKSLLMNRLSVPAKDPLPQTYWWLMHLSYCTILYGHPPVQWVTSLKV